MIFSHNSLFTIVICFFVKILGTEVLSVDILLVISLCSCAIFYKHYQEPVVNNTCNICTVIQCNDFNATSSHVLFI